MKKILAILFIFSIFLSACGSSTSITPSESAPTTTATVLPTNTTIPVPTETPTPPMIDVDGVKVPDPKASNPELFDVTNPDSPISQFANQLINAGVTTNVDEIVQQLSNNDNYIVIRGKDQNYILATYIKEGYSMSLIFDEQTGWQQGTPKELTKILNEKNGKNFTIGYQLASNNRALIKAIDQNFNHAMIDGPIHWQNIFNLEIDKIADPKTNEMPVKINFNLQELKQYIDLVQSTDINSMEFHHIIWGLKSGSFQETSEQLISLHKDLASMGYSEAQINNIYSLILEEGVKTVITQIKADSPKLANRIISLVNEPRPAGKLRIDGRPQVWADELGEDYISKAFEAAAPLLGSEDVVIINNTDNLTFTERSNSDFTRLVKIKNDLESRGIHIRIGYGIQGTIDEANPPNMDQVRANIKRFVDAGFEVFITEGRAKKSSNPLIAERQKTRANELAKFLNVVLEEKANGFTMFFHDNGGSTQTDLTVFDRTTGGFSPNLTIFAINTVLINEISQQ